MKQRSDMGKVRPANCVKTYTVYKTDNPKEIVFVGRNFDLVFFFNMSSPILYSAFKHDEDVIAGYKLRLSTPEEIDYLFGTFPYQTLGEYIKYSRKLSYSEEAKIDMNIRDYSYKKGRPNRYRDSSSVRFTPL